MAEAHLWLFGEVDAIPERPVVGDAAQVEIVLEYPLDVLLRGPVEQ
jgi:hypothetical protein